jgi:hypothetical protein
MFYRINDLKMFDKRFFARYAEGSITTREYSQMNSHTPGPWKFRDDSLHFKTNPFSVYVQGGGVHSAAIANVPFKRTIPEAQARANAMLISAAPELLDAVLTLLAVCWDLEIDDATVQAVARARAAIAKATGEQA